MKTCIVISNNPSRSKTIVEILKKMGISGRGYSDMFGFTNSFNDTLSPKIDFCIMISESIPVLSNYSNYGIKTLEEIRLFLLKKDTVLLELLDTNNNLENLGEMISNLIEHRPVFYQTGHTMPEHDSGSYFDKVG